MRMKTMLFRVIFFGFLGISGIVMTILMPSVFDKEFSHEINEIMNILTRIFMGDFSIVLLLVPYIFLKNGITESYYEASKYKRAIIEFSIITLALPGIVSLSYMFFLIQGSKRILFSLILLIAFVRYAESFYLSFWSKDKTQKNTDKKESDSP